MISKIKRTARELIVNEEVLTFKVGALPKEPLNYQELVAREQMIHARRESDPERLVRMAAFAIVLRKRIREHIESSE